MLRNITKNCPPPQLDVNKGFQGVYIARNHYKMTNIRHRAFIARSNRILEEGPTKEQIAQRNEIEPISQNHCAMTDKFAKQTDKILVPQCLSNLVSFKKVAFTLAEVLITLGIIGVVAAMTMPTLIANHKKKVVATRLKQTYSQLSQAIQNAQAEYGDYSGWDEANVTGTIIENFYDRELVKVFADKYILPYLKTTSTPEIAYLKAKGYKKGILKQNGEQYVNEHYPYYFAELTNGVTLLFTHNGNGTTGTIEAFLIWIDIDGASGENRLGHDIFGVHFNSEIGLKPREVMSLIMQNGWEIPPDYPW